MGRSGVFVGPLVQDGRRDGEQLSSGGQHAALRAGALRAALGAERLSGFDRAVGGDPTRALDLYSWNAAVSAAVFEDLGVLEVVLRNACHTQLRLWKTA